MKIALENDKIGKFTWETPEVVKLALQGIPKGTRVNNLITSETAAVLQESIATGIHAKINAIICLVLAQITASCHCGSGIALQLEAVQMGGEFSLKVQKILLEQFELENDMAQSEDA